MKIKIIAPLLLISLAPLHAIADSRPTLFVERIGGASLDVDEDDPIYFGQVDPHARFKNGSGTAFRAAASLIYIGYSSLLSRSRTTNEELEYRTYSIGISSREKYDRSEFAAYYYNLALGIGHSEVIFNSGRTDHNFLAELQGSLGVVFLKKLSVGVGANISVLGYPGETTAFSTSPYITAGIWF